MPSSLLPVSPEQLSDLLLLLHGVASKPQDLGRVQKMCSRYVGASNSTLGICEGRTGKVRFVDYFPADKEFADQYEAHYRADDPVKNAAMLAAPRKFWTRDQLIPADVLQTHPFFTEWCYKNGYDDVCIARVPMGGDYHGLWAFSRSRDQPKFSRRELDFLEMLLPHAEQALALHNHIDRLGVFADIAHEQLTQSGHGLVLLNEDGNVTYLNRVAARLVGEGGAVSSVDGKLRLADTAAAERFDELVRVCTSAAQSNTILAGGSVPVPREGESPVAVTVMPYRRKESFPTLVAVGGRVVVTLFDPDRPRLDTRTMLREMYRLSETEAEVCWRLGNGETLEEIALEMSSTRETVRSQLKRVFTKTGTNRQSDLVRLVLLGPAAWNRALP
jgi:DNA-binding CsgD family transcriptional regulator